MGVFFGVLGDSGWTMISEKSHLPEEPEFSRQYEYSTKADPTIHKLWVDGEGWCWLESCDGTQICVPPEIRGLIAKRVRETQRR